MLQIDGGEEVHGIEKQKKIEAKGEVKQGGREQ